MRKLMRWRRRGDAPHLSRVAALLLWIVLGLAFWAGVIALARALFF